MKRGFADIAEGQVHYRTARPAIGSGKRPLIMFHGSPGSSRSLERLVANLGRSRIVIAFDTLGQGDSCAPARPDVTMAYYGEAYSRALAWLGPDFAKVDTFGTHTGARTAAELAIYDPGRVNKVILDGMRRGTSDFWREYAAYVDLSRYIDQEGTQFFKAWTRLRDQYLFFPPYMRDAAHMRAKELPAADEMHDHALEVFKGIRTAHIPYRLAVLYPSEDRLPLIRVPTLSTCAPNDGPFGDIDYVASLIPGCVAKPHPHRPKMSDATDEEIANLSAMLTDWLDS